VPVPTRVTAASADALTDADLAVIAAFARSAHDGQRDRAGRPYFQHPLWVANGMKSRADKAVALLHDVIEDTDRTLDDLRWLGLPEELVLDVDAITKRRNEPLEDSMFRVRQRPRARRVKRRDVAHNMHPERRALLQEADAARLRIKYERTALALHDNLANIMREHGVA